MTKKKNETSLEEALRLRLGSINENSIVWKNSHSFIVMPVASQQIMKIHGID